MDRPNLDAYCTKVKKLFNFVDKAKRAAHVPNSPAGIEWKRLPAILHPSALWQGSKTVEM
jgi:hypothetical protein